MRFLPLAIVLVLSGCDSPPPKDPAKGRVGLLKRCPDRPNCVSSEAHPSSVRHYVAPIDFAGPSLDAVAAAITALKAIPGAKIVENSSSEGYSYLRAEVTSKWLRFVDDVEVVFDPKNYVIHFRSASRVGYSDMGVNRKRMEQFKVDFVAEIERKGQSDYLKPRPEGAADGDGSSGS